MHLFKVYQSSNWYVMSFENGYDILWDVRTSYDNGFGRGRGVSTARAARGVILGSLFNFRSFDVSPVVYSVLLSLTESYCKSCLFGWVFAAHSALHFQLVLMLMFQDYLAATPACSNLWYGDAMIRGLHEDASRDNLPDLWRWGSTCRFLPMSQCFHGQYIH